jgi:hypothetical protein
VWVCVCVYMLVIINSNTVLLSKQLALVASNRCDRADSRCKCGIEFESNKAASCVD